MFGCIKGGKGLGKFKMEFHSYLAKLAKKDDYDILERSLEGSLARLKMAMIVDVAPVPTQTPKPPAVKPKSKSNNC